ncbi:MAG: hypothetical protein GY806_09215 [Gammaproteobacteria bacterium]|nr:hypothetical protein [Gammaproteobacteria bacterium]
MSIPATIQQYNIVLPTHRQQDQDARFSRERNDAQASRQNMQSRHERPTTEYVFRGELLDAVDQQRRYRPQPAQQVSPQNRIAIENYLASDGISVNDDPRGRILDQFV